MNIIDHNQLYQKALEVKNNTGQMSFEIGDLLNLPIFFERVKCKIDQNECFQMYLGGADDGVALRFFWNRCYENTTLSIWHELAKSATIVVDIGAHTGAYTLAAKAANKNKIVFSFEPFFMNYSRLLLNLKGNGFETSNAYMYAVSDNNGNLPFTVTTNLSYLSQGGKLGSTERGHVSNVQVIALDQAMPKDIWNRISLIKMDTEGHEEKVLRGMTSIIASCKPIIFLESLIENSNNSISHFLKNFDYQFFVSNDESRVLSVVDNISPIIAGDKIQRETLNRIAVPNERLEIFCDIMKHINVMI